MGNGALVCLVVSFVFLLVTSVLIRLRGGGGVVGWVGGCGRGCYYYNIHSYDDLAHNIGMYSFSAPHSAQGVPKHWYLQYFWFMRHWLPRRLESLREIRICAAARSCHAFMPLANMPNTLVFATFSLLCITAQECLTCLEQDLPSTCRKPNQQ